MASVTHLTNQSQFVQANAAFNGTNITGTIASNGISLSVAAPGAGGGIAAAAGSQTQTNGTLVFSNSNGITFGMSNSSVITASHNGLTTAMASNRGSDFVQATAVFNGTNASGTIASNAISVSVAAPLTAATDVYDVGSAGSTGTAVRYAREDHVHAGVVRIHAGSNVGNTAGNTVGKHGDWVVAGSNNVTISGSTGGAGVHTVWVSGPTLTQYLTTAMASNASTQFVQANAVFNGTNASGTIASNAISISVAAPAAGVGIVAGTRTATTANNLVFSQANGITFGLEAPGGSVMTASHNGLTTAAQSNQVVNSLNGSTGVMSVTVASSLSMSTNGSTISFGLASNITTALQSAGAYLTTARASNDAIGLNSAFTAGPLAMTINSSGLSLNAASAAGTTSGFGGNLISGSMTHNTAGLNLSLNHPAWLTTAMQSNAATISNIRVSAGTTSNLLSALTFSNSNGVSFGINGSTMTASHNGLTTARASNDGIGTNTAQSNVTWTVNSAGLSLDARGYAGTGTTFNGANISGSMTVNSVGVQLSLSAGAGGGVTPVASASNGSFSFTTLAFSNANNVTFGTSAGSIITASVAAPGAAAENNWVNLLGANTAGNTTASGSTIGYSGINLTLSGTNGSVVNISAPPVSSIIGASGISVSTNGSTISVGKVLQSTYAPYMAYSTNSQTLAALGATSASARFFPIFISDNIAFNALRVMHNLSYATSSVSGQQTITYGYGLFSNNAGTLSSISSSSFSLAVTNSSISNTVSYPVSTGTAGYTYTTLGASSTATIQSFWGTAAGGRPLDLQFGNSMTLSSGMYWLGVILRHSSSSANIGVSIAIGGNANALHNSLAPWGVASSAETTNSRYRVPYHGLGAYTVSVSSLPNGVPLTQIAHTQTVMPLLSFLSTT